jgi:metal-responsive CopG/Arc/MetJ family transcriptional regulator
VRSASGFRAQRGENLAFWYNPGYTTIVKTAISIPEELFESAEEFARGRGMSRSELYATALRRYLEEHRAGMITERLDEIYGTESDGLDPDIARLQARALPEDDW